MIWESAHWKDGLLKDASIIRRWADRPATERQSVLLEKKIFLAAYVVRKLSDARKISDSLRLSKISVVRYPATGASIDLMNWHNLDRFFDFDKSAPDHLFLRELCNQIIHSLAFMIKMDGGSGVSGFLFSSDRSSAKSLYEISVGSFVNLMDEIGGNYPATGRFVRDPTTGRLLEYETE